MNSIVSEEKQMDVRHLFPSVPRTELPGALCFSPVAGRELSELLWLCAPHQSHQQAVTHLVASALENWGPRTHCKQEDKRHQLSALQKRKALLKASLPWRHSGAEMAIRSHPRVFSWISILGWRVPKASFLLASTTKVGIRELLPGKVLWWPWRLISSLGNQLFATLLPPLPPRGISVPVWGCWIRQPAMEASRYSARDTAVMAPQAPFRFSLTLLTV